MKGRALCMPTIQSPATSAVKVSRKRSFKGLTFLPMGPSHFHQFDNLIGAHFELKVIGSLVGFIRTFSLRRHSAADDKVSPWRGLWIYATAGLDDILEFIQAPVISSSYFGSPIFIGVRVEKNPIRLLLGICCAAENVSDDVGLD